MIFYQTMPPLSDDEYRELKASIEKNGIQVPVIIDEDGNVIDGHHRVMIANELGVKYPKHMLLDLTEEQKLDLSVSLNVDRRQLTREQKRQVIAAQLQRHPERSNREHARQLGMDHKTINSVRERLEAAGEIPHLTHTVGADGKQYPATRPAPEPQFVNVETGEILDVDDNTAAFIEADLTEDEFEQGLAAARHSGDLSAESVINNAPRKVTGLDGKTYSVPQQPVQQEPRTMRKPLPDQITNNIFDLSRKAERLDALTEDDRFPKNKEKVAARNRNDLLRTIDTLQRVLAKLDGPVE